MKTVEEHLEHAEVLQEHIKSADALVVKLKRELEICREFINWAARFGHPDFKISVGYMGDMPVDHTELCSLRDGCSHRIAAINALLGDKA